MTVTFEQLWRDLSRVGRSATSGGYFRQPFSAAERECHGWFVGQCRSRSLRIEHDGNGNTIGWWIPPGQAPDGERALPANPGGAVLTGSHLDSVLDGGGYDGPLGVVSALAAVDLLRERGFTPARPIGVAAFIEEEGSRFGLACLGTRLATGVTTPEQARALCDSDGIGLVAAMNAAGVPPDLGRSSWVDRIGWFVELHIEQGRNLVDRDAAVAVASSIWPHGRYRFDFSGEANHAGTTRMEDRHDPMLTFAMTALAANKAARLSGQRATFGRLEVVPNGTNAVPSRVTGWLDARCESEQALGELTASIERQARGRAERDGTELRITVESVSPATGFDTALADRLASRIGGRSGPAPIIETMAGHDAGVLANAAIPTAMLFVRNPTGVSHAPSESAEMADCLAGVAALADALQELAQ